MASKRQLLFGLSMDPLRVGDAVARCREALATRRRISIGMLNAAKIVKMRKDRLLREALLQCDMLLADGQSIVWASRLLGRPLPERVAGIDLFRELLHLAHEEKRSIYLLGARPEVLRTLSTRIQFRFPGLRIAGSHHGYFERQNAATIATAIRQSRADMLFIGMGTPDKEIFLATHGDALNVPILHGVGGSFDVLAGITKRAPLVWQRLGMEWAYRVCQEPRRLWRRYLVTNTAFIALTITEMVRPSHKLEPRQVSPDPLEIL